MITRLERKGREDIEGLLSDCVDRTIDGETVGIILIEFDARGQYSVDGAGALLQERIVVMERPCADEKA